MKKNKKKPPKQCSSNMLPCLNSGGDSADSTVRHSRFIFISCFRLHFARFFPISVVVTTGSKRFIPVVVEKWQRAKLQEYWTKSIQKKEIYNKNMQYQLINTRAECSKSISKAYKYMCMTAIYEHHIIWEQNYIKDLLDRYMFRYNDISLNSQMLV